MFLEEFDFFDAGWVNNMCILRYRWISFAKAYMHFENLNLEAAGAQ